jgi:hypothetical protein
MNMRSKLFALGFVLLLVAPVFAQERPVSQFSAADDGSVAILVRYVGSDSSADATMAVVQGGAITFEIDSTAYDGFECPVSGDLGGIIDVSDGDCDTVGEVVDTINGNCTGCSSDFRAVIVDALTTDASADFLADAADQVTRTDGLPIYFDTSANFAVGETRALIPPECRTDISCFITPNGGIIENPFAGQQTVVTWIEGYSTYASGTSILYVYSVKPSNKTATTERITTLWSEAMGATTANKQFTQFQYVPIYGRANEKVLVRVTNSAAQATTRLLVQAHQRPAP